jgi:hypothetical protein
MKILVYPQQTYVCATCGYHMFCEQHPMIKDMPLVRREIYCVNERCEYYGKRAVVKAQEVEVEERTENDQ